MNPDTESASKQGFPPQEPPPRPQNVGYPAQPQQDEAYPYTIQQGYPAFQPGYPYPPTFDQAGYPPPQQPAYPYTSSHPPPQPPILQPQLQPDAPPAYSEVDMPPQPQQQKMLQQSTDVVVVQQQPASTVHATTARPVGNEMITMSIILTIVVFLCCSWHILICTIPALILAIKGLGARQNGDTVRASSLSQTSLKLNIFAIVLCMMHFMIIIIATIVSVISSFR